MDKMQDLYPTPDHPEQPLDLYPEDIDAFIGSRLKLLRRMKALSNRIKTLAHYEIGHRLCKEGLEHGQGSHYYTPALRAYRIFRHAPYTIRHIGQRDVLKDLVKLTESNFNSLEDQVVQDINAPILSSTLGTQADAPGSMVPPMFDTPDL